MCTSEKQVFCLNVAVSWPLVIALRLGALFGEEHVGDDTDEDDCEACVEEGEVLINRNLDDVCGQRLWDEFDFGNS